MRAIRSCCFAALCLSIALPGCRKEQAIEVVPAFTYAIVDGGGNRLPADVAFTNTTTGATTYKWTFEGGSPATSDKKSPGSIRFVTAGAHKVTLEASNEDLQQKKEVVINLDSIITVAFDTAVLINSGAPATVRITNRSAGASGFEWTFEGGSPARYTGANPPDVTFVLPGDHVITLTAANSSGQTFSLTKKLTVGPALAAAFTIVPSFEDEDGEAPLTATLSNTTAGGTTWQWSASGGTISNPAAAQPTIYFPAAGTYTVTLVAGNGKMTQTVAQTITVKPNTNLRTLSNIRLGIASAQAGIGAFYSTRLRRSFTSADGLDTAGKWIDLVFFGLNEHFSYNKFISPDSAQAYAFSPIPQAGHTEFINSQELCGCGAPFTAADFDNMTDDGPLQGRTISPMADGTHQFSNASVPRIVLFRADDGRKGAIKIRQYVQAGAASYIIVDIKVQKS